MEIYFTWILYSVSYLLLWAELRMKRMMMIEMEMEMMMMIIEGARKLRVGGMFWGALVLR